ncbi:hypothetical protein NHX12_004203 [Muraenolepis orangiensis]|uniref:inositol-phosphate phosphatase n=1 Tax=Muraenolepis orangiensis TaxID=630683 RepID=A0A9Q0IEF0_9TELE|nr:hypothetical protein NHX12_004203 [Muraenolepis orangiensis]
MAPMGIRLSPLGVAIFCLLGVGVLYHLYAGAISTRVAAFRQGSKVDLRDLLALSVEAAVQGGKEVKQVRVENTLEERSKGKTKEGVNEFLTLGDLRSHKKMYYLMKNTYPQLKVNSEEHSSVGEGVVWNRDIPSDILAAIPEGTEVPAHTVTVWIDPLDATQEYTVDGEPIIGVIHKPFTGDTAWAFVGKGTNVRARASYSSSPPKVIVSRSHAGKVTSFIQEAFGNATTIIQAGGAGYKVLSLVEPLPHDTPHDTPLDQADVYIHVTYIKKWDICAGAALVAALGGRMTTLKGEAIDYRGNERNTGGLVATVGLDHKALLEKLPTWDPEKH